MCVPILLTYFNLPQPSVMLVQCVSHIVNLLQPASTQYDVGPVCVPILLTYFNLPQPSVMLSSVCPHIVNLLQPASTQCDVVQSS